MKYCVALIEFRQPYCISYISKMLERGSRAGKRGLEQSDGAEDRDEREGERTRGEEEEEAEAEAETDDAGRELVVELDELSLT